MSKVRFSRREFLNKPGFHTVGNIMIEFEEAGEGGYDRFYSSMYISNCDRASHFQLDVDTIDGVDNSVFKLSKIIEVCEKAREELLRMRPEVDQWVKEREKKEAEKKAKKKKDK